MRVTLAVVVGLLVGAAMSSACGTTSKCGPTTCQGCCDASGACQTGALPLACGLGGALCQSCPFGACVNGACGSNGSGGSGGTGGTGGTGGAGGGGGTASGGGPGPATFRAYTVVTAATVLNDPNCYRDNVLPADTTIASHTFEVLVWQTPGGRSAIALPSIVVRLGDSPAIAFPSAIETATNATNELPWQRLDLSPFSATVRATEGRQTQAVFTFDSLSTASTNGTLQLRAQYSCLPGPDACPNPNPHFDTRSCQLTLTFSAQLVPLTARWTTPSAAAVPGATRYLVTLDTGPLLGLATPSCFRNNTVPTYAINTTNARALDVWQLFNVGPTAYLRTSSNTFKLGDSPNVYVNGDLASDGGSFELRTLDQRAGPGTLRATELRSGHVWTTFPGGDVVTTRLQVASQYACVSGADLCPSPSPATDSASCAVGLDLTAAKLP